MQSLFQGICSKCSKWFSFAYFQQSALLPASSAGILFLVIRSDMPLSSITSDACSSPKNEELSSNVTFHNWSLNCWLWRPLGLCFGVRGKSKSEKDRKCGGWKAHKFILPHLHDSEMHRSRSEPLKSFRLPTGLHPRCMRNTLKFATASSSKYDIQPGNDRWVSFT